jgi:hypothetical protein
MMDCRDSRVTKRNNAKTGRMLACRAKGGKLINPAARSSLKFGGGEKLTFENRNPA